MPKPFRIQISFTGYYPTTPSYDATTHEPIITDGVFTELITYDNNLVLTNTVADQFSRAVNRYILSGDFVIKGDQYDDIQTAKAAGFTQLIIKYEQYSAVGAAYVQVYSGFVYLDGETDVNPKTIKLSQFDVIDKYTDLLNGMNIEKVNKNFVVDTVATGTTTQGYLIQGFHLPSLIMGNEQYSKQYLHNNLTQYQPVTAATVYIFGVSTDGTSGKQLYWGEMKRAKGSVSPNGITYTVVDVLKLYSDLFDLEWDIITPWVVSGIAINQLIVKPMTQVYNRIPAGRPDYSTESADFTKSSFIQPELNRIESWQMSKYSVDTDHIGAGYEYDASSNMNKKKNYSKYFTDFDFFITGTIANLDDDDIVLGVANYQVAAPSRIVDVSTGITHGGSLANYISAQANRLKNWLDNYRQLDSANYNGSIQALNATTSAPTIEQEPFYVNEDLITDIDIFRQSISSLGVVQIKSISQGFYDTRQKLICIQ